MAGNLKELTDENFQKEVIESELPVLVDFWAPWCGPCKMITPMVEKLAQEYQCKVKVGKVNTDDSPDTAGKYNISAIPTLLIFKGGKIMDQVVGIRSREDLIALIEKYI